MAAGRPSGSHSGPSGQVGPVLTAGPDRRCHRLKMSVAGYVRVELLQESSRRLQSGGRVQSVTLIEGDSSAELLNQCFAQLRSRLLLDAVEKANGRVERPGVTFRLGSNEGSLRAVRRVGRESSGSLQERGCPQEPTSCSGPLGGLLELERDGFVMGHRGARSMPGTNVSVPSAVCDLSQSPMGNQVWL